MVEGNSVGQSDGPRKADDELCSSLVTLVTPLVFLVFLPLVALRVAAKLPLLLPAVLQVQQVGP